MAFVYCPHHQLLFVSHRMHYKAPWSVADLFGNACRPSIDRFFTSEAGSKLPLHESRQWWVYRTLLALSSQFKVRYQRLESSPKRRKSHHAFEQIFFPGLCLLAWDLRPLSGILQAPWTEKCIREFKYDFNFQNEQDCWLLFPFAISTIIISDGSPLYRHYNFLIILKDVRSVFPSSLCAYSRIREFLYIITQNHYNRNTASLCAT